MNEHFYQRDAFFGVLVEHSSDQVFVGVSQAFLEVDFALENGIGIGSVRPRLDLERLSVVD